MKSVLGVSAVVLFLVSLSAQSALALPQFKKAFDAKYTKTSKSSEFKAAAKKASCNICHVKGAKKDVQNEYGKALNKLIEGDANNRQKKAKQEGGPAAGKAELAKILAEIDKAFPQVAEEKSPTGETFGELLKEGKLPVDPVWAAAEYKKKKKEAGEDVADEEEADESDEEE